MMIIRILLLLLLCNTTYAEYAMQPPTQEYDSCNDAGTICSTTEIDYFVEDGQKIASVGGTFESNNILLLNLDHYYRKECDKELGLTRNQRKTKNDIAQFGECLINKLTPAIQNRNKENIDYLNKTKEIFK